MYTKSTRLCRGPSAGYLAAPRRWNATAGVAQRCQSSPLTRSITCTGSCGGVVVVLTRVRTSTATVWASRRAGTRVRRPCSATPVTSGADPDLAVLGIVGNPVPLTTHPVVGRAALWVSETALDVSAAAPAAMASVHWVSARRGQTGTALTSITSVGGTSRSTRMRDSAREVPRSSPAAVACGFIGLRAPPFGPAVTARRPVTGS